MTAPELPKFAVVMYRDIEGHGFWDIHSTHPTYAAAEKRLREVRQEPNEPLYAVSMQPIFGPGSD